MTDITQGAATTARTTAAMPQPAGAVGELQNADLAVSTGDCKFPILGGEFDINGGCLKEVARKLLALADHFITRRMDGRTLRGEGTGTARAAAGFDLVRVPLNDFNILKRNAQPFGNDLRIGG